MVLRETNVNMSWKGAVKIWCDTDYSYVIFPHQNIYCFSKFSNEILHIF